MANQEQPPCQMCLELGLCMYALEEAFLALRPALEQRMDKAFEEATIMFGNLQVKQEQSFRQRAFEEVESMFGNLQ